MSIRKQKGQAIAASGRVIKRGNLWLVPSQSGRGKYTVNAEAQSCSCPDFDIRRQPCKHIFAVEETIERTKTTVTEDGKTTVTETEKITRKTYPQVWPAYNKAQTKEKAIFQYLLHQLCQGVGSPAQHGPGQRRLPMEDMLFATAFKVYTTVSGRRFMSDMTEAHAKGYTSKLPAYNSIFNYFESEVLTPHLLMLIEE